MIDFEISESPDQDVIGVYHLFKNEVYLGQTLTEIKIKDPLLLDSHAFMEVLDDKLLFHPQKDVSHYLLNGKRALTIRKLKAGDTIQIGKTVMKINHFNYTPNPSRKEILDQKLASLVENQDPRLEAITSLGQLMK